MTQNMTGIASWENLVEESYLDFGICLFLLRSKQKMTFFVVTIFNLGHFTCVGPMYDSDYELAILLIQLILVFKMEMTNKNI